MVMFLRWCRIPFFVAMEPPITGIIPLMAFPITVLCRADIGWLGDQAKKSLLWCCLPMSGSDDNGLAKRGVVLVLEHVRREHPRERRLTSPRRSIWSEVLEPVSGLRGLGDAQEVRIRKPAFATEWWEGSV